jgi:hypothetical protein
VCIDRRSGGEGMLSVGCVDTSVEISDCPRGRRCSVGYLLLFVDQRKRSSSKEEEATYYYLSRYLTSKTTGPLASP